MPVPIPVRLAETCRRSAENSTWLAGLPDLIAQLQDRWSLRLRAPYDGDEVSCAWVAPAALPDGTRAVLKIAMPHMEAQHEIQGLRFWNGEPTVRLLAADEARQAMLLERCEPGTFLRRLPEPEQDRIIAGLLGRLWRKPDDSHPFRSLAEMIAYWSAETLRDESSWPDRGLVRRGLDLFAELAGSAPAQVLLATDLHAGNVLRARRQPWLVIDPKPFVGDPAYDATQHLFNCRARLLSDPAGAISRFADLLEISAQRVGLWMFARAAAEPRDDWDADSILLAQTLDQVVWSQL